MLLKMAGLNESPEQFPKRELFTTKEVVDRGQIVLEKKISQGIRELFSLRKQIAYALHGEEKYENYNAEHFFNGHVEWDTLKTHFNIVKEDLFTLKRIYNNLFKILNDRRNLSNEMIAEFDKEIKDSEVIVSLKLESDGNTLEEKWETRKRLLKQLKQKFMFIQETNAKYKQKLDEYIPYFKLAKENQFLEITKKAFPGEEIWIDN